MKIVIAFDSFKGSLTALQACEACRDGVLQADPSALCRLIPLGDGGEGTMEAVSSVLGLRRVSCQTVGPLGDPLEAGYFVSDDGRSAYIDLASASGHSLIPEGRRDVMRATTRGTGLMMAHAIAAGARRIILGLGGSATVDGGMGLLSALGAGFFDDLGAEVLPGGAALSRVARIDTSALPCGVTVEALCDVDNPLLGPCGAARVFAPQKGASPAQVLELERGLARFAAAAAQSGCHADPAAPGCGAAGGVGYGLSLLPGATLSRGIDKVLGLLRFSESVAGADLVITGEGCLDSQSLHGKVPVGVLRIATRHSVPVVAVAGSVLHSAALDAAGFAGIFSVTPGPCTLAEAMRPETAMTNIRTTAREIIRMINNSTNR